MRNPLILYIADTMRESIRRYISVRRFRCLRTRILPFAEARGLFTDDDIFMNLG